MLISELISVGACLIEDISVKDNFSTVGFRAVYLDERCGYRHNDCRLNACKLCGVSDALCMVSGRCCDQTAGALFRCELADLIVSAAYLVSTGTLHVLRFKIDLVSVTLREIFAVDQLCLLCHFLYDLGSFFKFFEAEFLHFHLYSPYCYSLRCHLLYNAVDSRV